MEKFTAAQIAEQLRELADALDQHPNLELEPFSISSPHIGKSDKERFLNLVRCLPRPIAKEWGNDDLKITWGKLWNDPVSIRATIKRDIVCRIVEPAKPAIYECEPLLTESEVDRINSA